MSINKYYIAIQKNNIKVQKICIIQTVCVDKENSEDRYTYVCKYVFWIYVYTYIFSFVYTFIDFVCTYAYILCACFHVCVCVSHATTKEYGWKKGKVDY